MSVSLLRSAIAVRMNCIIGLFSVWVCFQNLHNFVIKTIFIANCRFKAIQLNAKISLIVCSQRPVEASVVLFWSCIHLILCRAWGQQEAPAGPHRPQLCIADPAHTPSHVAGSSSPAAILRLRDQAGCIQTSSHTAGTGTHHTDRLQSPPKGRASH